MTNPEHLLLIDDEVYGEPVDIEQAIQGKTSATGIDAELPAHVQAAQAFNALAMRLMKESDGSASQDWIAHLIGEASGNYSAALSGKRGGSLKRVQRWIEAWEATSYPPMKLVLGPSGVKVVTKLCSVGHPNQRGAICFRPTGHHGPHMATRTVEIRTGFENALEGLLHWTTSEEQGGTDEP